MKSGIQIPTPRWRSQDSATFDLRKMNTTNELATFNVVDSKDAAKLALQSAKLMKEMGWCE